MKKILPLLLLSIGLITILLWNPFYDAETSSIAPKIEKTLAERAENSKGRQEHFFRLTRNPATNEIPRNIRTRELAHAEFLENSFKYKSNSAATEIDIVEAGPNDVGGRTRGLGLDVRNSNIILAGAASGGMWKSTDGGATWSLKSTLGQNLGVTSLVQDPNNLDTWYYATGEFSGASSRARGGGGQYYGSGIYVSTDNGDSWSQIENTADDDVAFNSEYDFISRVAISPTTGTKFFASNAVGIFRSTDNFVNNTLVLGDVNEHVYSDVQVASNGTVVAAISRAFNDVTPFESPGVYVSTDDGLNWTEITPNTYPSAPGRAVIGISKSDPNQFYVFAADNSNNPSLYYFNIQDLNNVLTSDRTANIPDFGEPVGDLNLQGGYNMVCEVHPSDPDFLIIGGTNLYRSTNGFATKPVDINQDGTTDDTELAKYWIGGYDTDNDISQYPSHHPDQHVIVFDPNSNDRVVSGHDGGLSLTINIKSNSVSWISLNNSYNVTQFYTVTLHPDADDTRILGGTQDNGSPFFRYNSLTGTSGSFDISSGDGAYSYFGRGYLTTSSQRGRLIQYRYDNFGEPTNFSYIAPLSASGQLFIHPYLVNPLNENVIFYPAQGKLFRNNSAGSITINKTNSNGTNEGWSELTEFELKPGRIISTLEISSFNPFDVLYYATYSSSVPQIYRLENASSSTSISDLSIKSFTELNSDEVPIPGSYIHDIAIAEDDGNELLVVISNYETESIYYTTDGGDNWSGIGGNLEPANGNGPSVRSAAIVKTTTGEKTYFVGTSTGLYATNEIDGANTEWKLQGANTIGKSIVEYLDYRKSDKTLAIATHGRGIFIGNASTSVSNEDEVSINGPAEFNLAQNYPNPFNPSTTISYSIPVNSEVNINVYDINGRIVANLLTNESKTAGEHSLNFNATNLASGVYFYKMDAKSLIGNKSFSIQKKMTLIK